MKEVKTKAPDLTLNEVQAQRKGKYVFNYVEWRDYVIRETINACRTVWPGDIEILNAVINMTTHLKVADPAPNFIADLKGFMMYCTMTNQDAGHALSTIIHDLSEFSRNRHQAWFCPRTTGYGKYLSGASNIKP